MSSRKALLSHHAAGVGRDGEKMQKKEKKEKMMREYPPRCVFLNICLKEFPAIISHKIGWQYVST
jgi:hypothetical protein